MMERMTAAEFRRQKGAKGSSREPKQKPTNKYAAEKIVVQGISFDSKHEARRFEQLRLLEKAGVISELKLQQPIPLLGRDGPLQGPSGRILTYRADFTYWDTNTGEKIIEDAKGFQTKDYKLKRAILAAQGIKIVEV